MFNSLRPHRLKHARLPCPSPSPTACSNSCPLSQWCHPTISSSVALFTSSLQSFPASGSFLMSQLFTSDGQRTYLYHFTFLTRPVNIQVSPSSTEPNQGCGQRHTKPGWAWGEFLGLQRVRGIGWRALSVHGNLGAVKRNGHTYIFLVLISGRWNSW